MLHDNIIFYDSEFSSLDPYKGELLSVALVKPDGEEFYAEIEYGGDLSPWAREHIAPMLTEKKISRAIAKDRITEFLGKNQPHLVAFVPQYDMLFLHKLFGVGDAAGDDLPYHWMPFDFATVLFWLGMDPKAYSADNKKFFAELGIDTDAYTKHHALHDARLLRDAWEKVRSRV